MKWPWTKPKPPPKPALHSVRRCLSCGYKPVRCHTNDPVFLVVVWFDSTVKRICPKCQASWLERDWGASQ